MPQPLLKKSQVNTFFHIHSTVMLALLEIVNNSNNSTQSTANSRTNTPSMVNSRTNTVSKNSAGIPSSMVLKRTSATLPRVLKSSPATLPRISLQFSKKLVAWPGKVLPLVLKTPNAEDWSPNTVKKLSRIVLKLLKKKLSWSSPNSPTGPTMLNTRSKMLATRSTGRVLVSVPGMVSLGATLMISATLPSPNTVRKQLRMQVKTQLKLLLLWNLKVEPKDSSLEVMIKKSKDSWKETCLILSKTYAMEVTATKCLSKTWLNT